MNLSGTKILPTGLGLLLALPALSAPDPLVAQAQATLRRAAEFFHSKVAVEGTYLWEYSEDLALREGEGVAAATQGWVQPPGTPRVGQAFLKAWQATADPFYLEAARDTARGLVRGQLRSGGWYYHIDFAPHPDRPLAYRHAPEQVKARNITTLDDDTTQSALRFLMAMDETLGFEDRDVHEAVGYALDRLLQAQYPNGAWPQGYDRFPKPEEHPIRPASHPESWSRTWPGSQDYWYRYTLNDGVMEDMVETMFQGADLYERAAHGEFPDSVRQEAKRRLSLCRSALERAGRFLILAQLPDPQPAWAQQYGFDMAPSWARKFEPPAVTGGESQGIIRTLLQLHQRTGNSQYLKPIGPALDYLERSRLPDGRLARFYELGSNRPLYFDHDYHLTYDDSDVPTHYAFKVEDQTAVLRREYEAAQKGPNKERLPSKVRPERLREEVRRVVSALDDAGRWLEPGPLRYHRPKDPSIRVLRSSTFVRHVELLSSFLMGQRTED